MTRFFERKLLKTTGNDFAWNDYCSKGQCKLHLQGGDIPDLSFYDSENVDVDERHDDQRSQNEAQVVEVDPVAEVDDLHKATVSIVFPTQVPTHRSQPNLQEVRA